MNANTLSDMSKRAAYHAPVVLILFTSLMLMFASYSLASSAEDARGEIDGSGGVCLRSSSSTSSAVLDVLADNTEVTIHREIYKSRCRTSRTKRWYYVTANGTKGYVRADCVDSIRYTEVKGTTISSVNYRTGPGTGMKKKGKFGKGQTVTIVLEARPVRSASGKSRIWYRVRTGSGYGFVSSSYVRIAEAAGETGSKLTDEQQISRTVDAVTDAFTAMTDAQFENYMKKQGFPASYKKSLRKIRRKHPNWVFVACRTGLKWKDVLKKQTSRGVSLIYKSYPSAYRSKKYKGQAEPGWYNADPDVVAYYLDPRNFLNEDRIYMFEDLAYQSEYQTVRVVNKIISGTGLPGYGFTCSVFMNAGKKYNISPVFLAARVVQETGGRSDSVNGSKSGGKVVYNPFNVGAYGSNPVRRGLRYARKMGWTTPARAVNGGADYLASGYISKKQNTIYFQRFNVANGITSAGRHQYMTNIMAPYSEAHITKSSYDKLGISSEPLGFIIPVYKNMPSATRLP